MLNFITNNWFLVIIIIAAIAILGYNIYIFIKRPTSEQLAKVKEWLLFAVTKAEKELGGGTGQIKLRYVYDMFLSKFPFLTSAISFSAFSTLVDEVLEKFRDLLQSNASLQQYVENTTTENSQQETKS